MARCTTKPSAVGTLTPPMPDRVTALEMLTGAGIDPDVVAGIMPHVDPAAIPVKVANRWFRQVWFKGVIGMAFPKSIYVQPSVMDHYRAGVDLDRWARLIVHELMHVEQWRRLGVTRHLAQYLGDYFRNRLRGHSHRDAYEAIRLEVEARDAARIAFGGLP